MSDTSGPSGSNSLSSTDLASSLASRLVALLDGCGSTLYLMTWKAKATPLGRPYCQLVASVRRTSDNASSGWPTPKKADAERGGDPERFKGTKSQGGRRSNLVDAVQTVSPATWNTPTAKEAGGTPEQFLERKRRAIEKGSKLGVSLTSLNLQAQLATWATPTASNKARSVEFQDGRALNPIEAFSTQGMRPSGEKLTGLLAETGKPVLLNPDHSRWLIGLPPEWRECAPTEMPSSRKSRRSSSKP